MKDPILPTNMIESVIESYQMDSEMVRVETE